MDLKLKNKLVLVTGSTAGIGKATAEAFLAEGAEVIVNGRTEEKVQSVVDELSRHGNVHGIAADLSDPDESRALVEKTAEIGELDVLVNNMGFFEVKDFTEVTDEEWLNYFEVNVLSAVRLCRAFLPAMLKRNKGRILNLASEAGIKPLPQMIPYSMTKTALISLSRGLAEMTKGTNVTVNSVLPGPTWTEGVANYMEGAAAQEKTDLDTFVKDYFKVNEPTSLIQRYAKPEEVASTIVYLASEKAAAINGSAQRVEGGIIRSI
ncbi:3-oxoacyl-[acyl-carrier-protein] reductase FabG [Bacillus licheniformis]|uniref:SDR family NAD(P)-dependent oxidoreductase n=1 Tax=Bacillus haynesii TaxID=1925021 RepID=UPI0012B6F9EF|nr:SDR family oxidoreductase [Bacillus haynesii]TWK27714.1 3-oxoacyl-[acyl-carrier-protein] reductase FabG [Bacillus licheniformis]MBU8683444.1 SDR family oxidoreductase [Bacillus haynesii]MCY8436372.1 SDR family oxidoreductase [Bacillus haynesii]MCY8680488.1 SDR family oxidoreductase [Bacillus haynesii]MCY9155844.1 SDR family oxidoreductase [Bacillus haynesii]